MPIKLWGIRVKTEPRKTTQSQSWDSLLQDFAKIRNKLASNQGLDKFLTTTHNCRTCWSFQGGLHDLRKQKAMGHSQVQGKQIWLRNFWRHSGWRGTVHTWAVVTVCSKHLLTAPAEDRLQSWTDAYLKFNSISSSSYAPLNCVMGIFSVQTDGCFRAS